MTWETRQREDRVSFRWDRDACVDIMEQLADAGQPIMSAC